MNKTRNPDELIRIEDAIKVLCRKTCHPGVLCPDSYCVEMWDEFEDVERVDAVPVVHGRWTNDNACPFCGFQPWYERDIHTLLYCPLCGAVMDGKDGDHYG